MDTIERITDMWMAGKKAPFDLFEADHLVVRGNAVLVESHTPPVAPFIRKGDTISAELAERIKLQVDPPPLPSVAVHVLVLNEDGTPKLDADGHAVTELKMVEPEQIVYELSCHDDPVHPDHDMHCDQCGNLRADLFRIGDGWYCKELRTAPGEISEDAKTCFDRRLEQMK